MNLFTNPNVHTVKEFRSLYPNSDYLLAKQTERCANTFIESAYEIHPCKQGQQPQAFDKCGRRLY